MMYIISHEQIMRTWRSFPRSRRVLKYLVPSIELPVHKNRIKREGLWSVEVIEHAVCEHFECTIDKMLDKRRGAETILRRSVLMYMVYTFCNTRGADLSKRYGFDRTTLIHHAITIHDLLGQKSQLELRKTVKKILSNLWEKQ